MAYLMTRYHICGTKIRVHEEWTGQMYLISFADQDDQPIDNCPSCGDQLRPRDLGSSLVTESEYYAKALTCVNCGSALDHAEDYPRCNACHDILIQNETAINKAEMWRGYLP
jgi:hypothetical protein